MVNLTTGEQVFRWRQAKQRILASNTKLFTTAAALARFGPKARSAPRCAAREARHRGCLRRRPLPARRRRPSFGSARYAARYYGSPGATVESLAELLEQAGIERVTGRVIGDESAFDSLRGGPESGFGVSPWVGPLSGLSYNRGFADERPLLAARPASLRGRKARCGARSPRDPGPPEAAHRPDPRGRSHARERRLAPDGQAREITNKPSDNFFAEMLLKDLALQANGLGTTAAGARRAAGYACRLGSGVHLADGSGLARGPRLTPPDRPPARRGLPARSGAVRRRLRRLAADRGPGRHPRRPHAPRARPLRCRGKTGTLSNVSALGLLPGARGTLTPTRSS